MCRPGRIWSIKGVFFAGLLVGILEMVFPVFGQLIGSDFLGPHFKFTIVYLAYFIIVVFRPQGYSDGKLKMPRFQ